MIYVHSLGRAVRYYGEQIALSIGGKRLTFSELHNRVERIAAALSRRGLRTGDRLAVLLPNGPEYIELVYLRTPVHVRSCGTPVRRRPGRTSNGS
jgi:acyl-CoA synthetase (AMP-forming)/AMP-acid ligase II